MCLGWSTATTAGRRYLSRSTFRQQFNFFFLAELPRKNCEMARSGDFGVQHGVHVHLSGTSTDYVFAVSFGNSIQQIVDCDGYSRQRAVDCNYLGTYTEHEKST